MSYSNPTPFVTLPQKTLILPGSYVNGPLGIGATSGAGSANYGYYLPFTMPYTTTLLTMAWGNTSGTQSYDIGIYQGTTRLQSKGIANATSAAVNVWTLSPSITIQEGVLYFAAFATAGTTTMARFVGSSILNPRIKYAIQTGLTSNTLPNPAVFAAPAANGHVPILRLTFAT